PAADDIYTLPLHDALPICGAPRQDRGVPPRPRRRAPTARPTPLRNGEKGERRLPIAALLQHAEDPETVRGLVEPAMLRRHEGARSEEPRLNSSHVKISYAV